MKKYFFLFVTLAVVASACQKRPDPCFTYTSTPGNLAVSFSNCSENAVNYMWNYGDGTYSDTPSPTHTYDTTGTYQVTLQATASNDVYEEETQTVVVE